MGRDCEFFFFHHFFFFFPSLKVYWFCVSLGFCQVIYCPKEVQLICLSATVANPDELAGWIGEVSL